MYEFGAEIIDGLSGVKNTKRESPMPTLICPIWDEVESIPRSVDFRWTATRSL
jgi:hypothetical protein